MRNATFVVVAMMLVFGGASIAQEPVSLTYDVVEVKRKLLLETQDGERRLLTGVSATSGDALRTGWWARAELAVPERAARFHLGSSTRFRLTHDRPGVLLELERGRLRTEFGPDEDGKPFPGERLVTTPSAVLAVRGTEYGVEVGKNGDTSVTVFEGIVEVRDAGGLGEPVRVGAAQSCRIRAGKAPSAPKAHNLGAKDWDRGRGGMGSSQGSRPQSSQMGNQQGGSKSPAGAGSSSGGGGSKRHGG
jgi:uncharacterized membrane protein YgcG